MIISGGATITGSVTINTNYVPNAPTIGIAIPLSSVSASVQFTQSTSTGGLAITSYTAVSSPGNISATVTAPSTSTGTIIIAGLSTGTAYTFSIFATNAAGNGPNSQPSNLITTLQANSSTTYPFPGTYSWIAPPNVNAVSIIAIGAGGGGAGTSSFGNPGGASYFIGTSTIFAGGGCGGTSSTQSLSTGTGTSGMVWYSGGLGGGATGTTGTSLAGGGGGAGGYSATGSSGTTSTLVTCAVPGSGAGGGGGAKLGIPRTGAGGGGVGIYGRGCTGQAGPSFNTYGQGGAGGSRGVAGCNGTTSGGQGGLFGGGGGSASSFGGAGGTLAYLNNYPVIPGNGYTVVVGAGGAAGTGTVAGGQGGSGVVRIVWPGQSRLFPTSCVSASCIACTPLFAPSTATVLAVTLTNYSSVIVTYSTATAGVFYTVTSYTAVVTPGGNAASVVANASASTGTIVINNLRPNTTYTVTVYASSFGGNGLPSAASIPFTTVNVPSTPVIGVATATGGTTAIVGYTASTSSGGAPITGYNIGSNPGGAVGRINTCGSGIISVTGLSANTVYNFYAYATNVMGNSAISANSNNTSTWTVPFTPTIFVSTVTNAISATVVVRPGAYNGGGGPITYTVLTNPGAGQGTLTYCGICAVPITVTGLAAASTYSFYAYATNSVGNSGLSPFLSTVTTFSTATPPIITVATATGISSALVGYIASTATGGPITSYNVITSPSGGFGYLNTSTSGVISVSNLIPGTSYQFAVYATNQYGASSTSSWSNSVTTFGRPLAPIITAVTATGATTALVGYTAPANSGSVIISYTALSVPAGGVGTINTCGSGVITVTGLPLFSPSYQFYVYATNAAGNGSTSSVSTTVSMITTATRPVIVSAAPLSANSAIVTFNASTATGSTITQYTAVGLPVIANAGALIGAGSITPCSNASQQSIVVSGLTANSTYTFYVYASNLYGNSTTSTFSTPVQTYGGPAAPIIGSAVGGPAGTAVVTFSPPPRTNGYPITGYTAVTSPAGGYGVASGCAGTINVVGLTPGVPYSFAVYATNQAGVSTTSNYSNTVTLFGAPTPPVVSVATATGASTAVVGYFASTASGFTITSYTAVSIPPAGVGTVLTSTSGVITVNGLYPNNIYSFYVYATNIYGTGTSVAVSNTVTTFGVPGRPTIAAVTATYGNTQALVGYIAPINNNGYPITSYTAYSTPGGGIGTINTCGSGVITVSGLQPNTPYSFSVYATNAVGNSTTSSPSTTVTTFGVPSAPILTIATATGASTANVGYIASTATGFTISYYTALSIPAGGAGILATTGSGVISVSGLNPDTAYRFYVYASNVYGSGTTSSYSNTVTTFGVPNSPTIGVAVASTSSTTAFVSYIPPGANNGFTITSYTALSNPSGGYGIVYTCGPSTIPVSGLQPNATYTFSVFATNAIGNSTSSSQSNQVLTFGTPTQAIIGIATATGPTTAIVGYAASTATGFSISEYVALSNPVGGIGTVFTSTGGTINVSGLNPGVNYNFTVYAINVFGNGSTSSYSNTVTTYTVPYAPVIIAATATGYTSATIVYAVTTNTNPNFPVLSYSAISNPGGLVGTVNTSSGGTIVVTGLSSSTSYRFQVYATNALGTGTTTTSSNTITTYGSILFTTASSYSWVVPWGVSSVSVLAIGGGGGGSGTAIGTTGSNSWFITGTVLLAQGGGGGGWGASPSIGGFGGTASGAYCAGYPGGVGGYGQVGSNLAGGGGGAGGYTAAGGAGSTGTTGTSVVAGSSTGYGGGGGGVRTTNFPRGGGGGGVGIYGTSTYNFLVAGGVTTASNGGGGAGGAGGQQGLCAICGNIGYGGIYGGGGGGTFTATFAGGAGGGGGALAYINNWAVIQQNTYFLNVGNGGAGGGTGVFGGGPGSTGTIRIVWPGNVRQFPGTCVGYP